MLIKNTLAIKEINDFKSNPDPDLESKDEDYSYYKKIKIAK